MGQASRVRRFYQTEDSGLTEAVADLIDAGALQIARVDRIIRLGASFGACHAANFAFRHPDVVVKVVGFSGKYDIHSFLDGHDWPWWKGQHSPVRAKSSWRTPPRSGPC
jgi:esterase/lipase superfamily enzyme